MELDAFTKGYIDCALWASLDDNDEPLDNYYGVDDLAEETLQSIIEDCKNFQDDNGKLFEENESAAGHDFWLTRNGHGAGFWDRGHDYYPNDADGKILTQKSHEYGSVELYVGDDGKIYSQ